MRRCTSGHSDCNTLRTSTSSPALAAIRALLTFDLDFGAILALGVLDQPSVITFRLADERPASVNQRLDTILRERAADLEAGALIMVEDTRYRVRKLPIGRADRS